MAIQTTIAVVAEKPSVARDIARILNANKRGEGYLHGDGYIVTWAIGHLVALAQPHEIRPEWRSWRRELLPMLPDSWPLVVGEKTRDQFDVVRRILTSPRVANVICATDAGREGELIFRYIYEAAGSDKPVQRLWISSLTPEAIRDGLEKLRDGHDYDPLANAARGRSRADWLVGMNLSRAYTLACQEEFSVGRVQTPTLAMLVDRELAIRSFVPEDYPLLLNYPYYLLYSSQVVKQADLVFALYLRGDRFDAEQKRRDFDYYEPITVRDSSLSASIQGIVAAEVGHLELAYDYLRETAFLDLHDLNSNTDSGLHLGSLAGAWLVAVAGFGGLRDHAETLAFAPRLPARITRLRFRLRYRGRRLAVDVRPDSVRYWLLDGEPLSVLHHGDPITITSGSPAAHAVPEPLAPAPVAPPPGRPAAGGGPAAG